LPERTAGYFDQRRPRAKLTAAATWSSFSPVKVVMGEPILLFATA